MGAVSQTKPVTGRSHPTPAHASPQPELKDRTPVERLLLPHLNARLASIAGVKSVQPEPLTALQQNSAAATLPYFGGYLAAPFYPARLEPSCVTDPYNCGVSVELTADFNKDGKPDIAVLQFDGTLNILLNNGAGGLSAPVSYLNPNYSTTSIQQGFAVDVNNDGYADIVEFDSSNEALIVYLNQKDGTFGAAQTFDLSQSYGNIGSIAMGDVNGDGIPDVVTLATNVTSPTSTSITVQSYIGTGTGSFATPGANLTQTITIPAQVQIPANTGITLGDLNKDGKLDVAMDFEEQLTQTTGVVVATVAIGDGDGSFGTINVNNPISVPIQAQPGLPFLFFSTAGVQILDLNNDGNPDLAMDSSGTLYVALGNGNGGFTSTVQTANFGVPTQVVYEDVTGDGIPDAVMDLGLLNVLVGNGDGTFTLPTNGNSFIIDGGSQQSIALADFTGDGNLDIAHLGLDYKQVSIFAGNGKGVFQGTPALSSTTDSFWSPEELEMEAAEDVAGNGLTDPLFVDYTGTSPYIVSGLSDGKGGFKYVTALSAAAVPTLAYLQPIAADFNGDGKQDMLIVDGAAGNDLAVALSNGDGTFQAPVQISLPSLDCALNYAATGDLKGNGKVDIVVTYPGDASCGGTDGTPSGYFVALGNGDGTFATPVFTASGNELYSATIADVNMDGNLDLILNDEPFDGAGSFAVDLLPGNGDGTFGAGSAVFSNYMVSQVVAGDYNQDGKPDLILFTEGEATSTNFYDTAGIVLLPGNGDGTFGDSNVLATGNFFLNGTLADVNNDGIPDLIAALYHTTGQPNTYYGLATMLGMGGGSFAPPINELESLDSTLPVAGNFISNSNAPGVIVSTAYGTAVFVGQGGTTLSLSASAASVAFGQSETLTATLTPALSGRPAPTGTITFYDGSTLLGSVSVSASTATYSASALAVGSHSITAVYSGDGNFNPNTSAAASVTITSLAPAFTLSANSGSVNVTVGQDAEATLTLTANATFSGNVSLTCTGLPTNASCSANPSQVTLSAGSTAVATLIVGTTASSASNKVPMTPFARYAGGLSLAGLFLCFVSPRYSRRLLSMLGLMLIAIAAIGLSGCGNGNGVSTAQKGTYTATVTATPANSAAGSQMATVSVTIQ